ncbi:MAG: hypothetical protein ABJC19_00910 [Gemmatimonadota bacterium]
MGSLRFRLLQRLLALGIIGLGVRSVLLNLDDLALKPVIWQLDWVPLIEGIACTVLAYAITIWTTGEIIQGWEVRVPALTVIRLWVRSNLARYSLRPKLAARLIAIAEQEAIPQKYFVGAALHPPLIRLGTGSAVAMVLLGLFRYGNSRFYFPMLLISALAVFVAVFGLAGTDLPRRIGQDVGRPEMMKPADTEALGVAVVTNVVAWTIGGLGLTLIGRGLLEGFQGDWMLITGAAAAASVAGYFFLLFPTGLLLREAVLYALLKRDVGVGPALALALAYRVIVTVLELLSSTLLLLRRPSRDLA